MILHLDYRSLLSCNKSFVIPLILESIVIIRTQHMGSEVVFVWHTYASIICSQWKRWLLIHGIYHVCRSFNCTFSIGSANLTPRTVCIVYATCVDTNYYDMDGLTPPTGFRFDGNVAENWRLFKQRFNLYLMASGAKDKESDVQTSIFWHVIRGGAGLYTTH